MVHRGLALQVPDAVPQLGHHPRAVGTPCWSSSASQGERRAAAGELRVLGLRDRGVSCRGAPCCGPHPAAMPRVQRQRQVLRSWRLVRVPRSVWGSGHRGQRPRARPRTSLPHVRAPRRRRRASSRPANRVGSGRPPRRAGVRCLRLVPKQ